jgi:hypothetical protein
MRKQNQVQRPVLFWGDFAVSLPEFPTVKPIKRHNSIYPTR